MDQHVGKQIGNYEVLELIGKGGMAAVYRGYQPSMNRNVAIKIMAQQFSNEEIFIQRFENEARLIAQLEHAHILPVYDFGQQEGLLYIIMRYLPAGTLEDRIQKGGMPLKEVVHLFTQVGNALEYAHSKGVIHRDLKPANILIDAQDNAFLSDFGIAKSLTETSNLTGTGGVVGTPTYMSPEQGLGDAIDARSDIYALGVMLFEMLTGRVPFTAENPMAVMLKHINDAPPNPSDINPAIPEAVSAIVLKALAKDPNERFQSAQDMADALADAASGSPKRPLPTYAGSPASTTMPAPPGGATMSAPLRPTPAPATAAGQVSPAAPAGQAVPPTTVGQAGAASVVQPVSADVAALRAMEEFEVHLNSLSAWINQREVLGVWVQAILLSLVTWFILNRLTQNALVETGLLALIPGVLLYGLLRGPTVGALFAFVLILIPLLAHTPGLALIWVIVIIIAGARLNSREILLTLVTMAAAGSPLGIIVPLLAPWWFRARRTALPVALGVMLAMMFGVALRWPAAGGLLPAPPISDRLFESIQITPFNTTFLGLFDSATIWSKWTDPQSIWNTITTTFLMFGAVMSTTGGVPLVVATAWGAASTLSVSNRRVASPWVRPIGLVMAFALLMIAHIAFRPVGLGTVPSQAILLAVVAAVIAFVFSQWPIQADPTKGNRLGTILRMLRHTLGALFMALGVAYFIPILGDSSLYTVFWIVGVAGTLMSITNPVIGPPLVFAALIAGLAPVRPGLAVAVAALLFAYLIVCVLFDRRRPRRWNPLGAGMILGAPGMAAVGILPLGALSLGALEAQVPAALLAVASLVLLIATAEKSVALAFIIQIVTTLAGTLAVERFMGAGLLGGMNQKVRRLIFTVIVGVLMALVFYTVGQVAPSVPLTKALLLTAITSAALVGAMGNRAMFWREFIEKEEEEHDEEILEDEEVTGPWAAQKQQ